MVEAAASFKDGSHAAAYRCEQMERFRAYLQRPAVVEPHNTTRGGFVVEEKQQALLIREMCKFLVGVNERRPP